MIGKSGPGFGAVGTGGETMRGSRGQRRYSLRASLFLLVVICVLPAVAVSSYLAYLYYQLMKRDVYRETEVLAKQISADLDRDLSAIESGLRVLATSEALKAGDLRRFHQVAREALKSQLVYNYVLTDPDGRQLVNTLLPYGSPLPAKGTPSQLQEVFRSGKAVLTDMFIGPVTQRPAMAMGVPVYREGRVAYSLNVGMAPGWLDNLLHRQNIPDSWRVAILDGTGTIIGRSHDAERFVGQKAVPQLAESVIARPQGALETVTKEGVPVVTSHLRSAGWQWSVAIGAPKTILENKLYSLLIWLSLVAFFLLVFGTWLAASLANRVISSVRQLNDAALAIGSGKPVSLPSVQLQEADAVGAAIVEASRLMAEVKHRAYHDALTDLPNRALFYELVHFQLAAAKREGGNLAILAIDLDNFKQVNDGEGHAKGDLLLKAVAERLTATLRSSDAAARMGGDEFSVLLSRANEASAADTARRLILALEKPYPGVATPVSASVGIAIYPFAGETLGDLLESADRALYKAKRAGKNTYAVALAAASRPDRAGGEHGAR